MAEGKEDEKKRTVFILYIPGGGMLGLLPLIILQRLEELTETPAIELFQVTEGVSIGGGIVAVMNIRDPENPTKPKFNCTDIFNLTCKNGPKFFYDIPNRNFKMGAAIATGAIQDKLDPLKLDAFIIDEINSLLSKLDKTAPADEKHSLNEIKELSCRQWYTKNTQKKAMILCEKFSNRNPTLSDITGDLYGLISTRRASGLLSIAFKRAVMSTAEKVQSWAKDFRFDPAVPQKTYKDLIGDMRMSDSLRTVYISANNRTSKEIIPFFCRKDDLFSLDPDTPSTTSKNNHKMYDAIMAVIANPLAFPPHTTEDGIPCDDRATLHMPLLNYINDLLKHKPENTTLKLVTLSTGWYVSSEVGKDKLFEDIAGAARRRKRYGVFATPVTAQPQRAYRVSRT